VAFLARWFFGGGGGSGGCDRVVGPLSVLEWKREWRGRKGAAALSEDRCIGMERLFVREILLV